MEGGKRHNVYLDWITVRIATQAGNGNMSDGLRKVALAYEENRIAIENLKALAEIEKEHRAYEISVFKATLDNQECWCAACKPNDFLNQRMILCAICGNKRCPHATDHRNACTNSNEVGQKGSSWEDVKPFKE